MPTVPGANPSTTQDAAPASSPKPTAPPVTAQPSTSPSITQPAGDPKQTQVNLPASEDPNHPVSTNGEDDSSHDPSTQMEQRPQDSSGQSPESAGVKSPPETSIAGDPATQKAFDKPSTAQSPHGSEASSDSSNDQSLQQADSPFQPEQSSLLTATVAGQSTGRNAWHNPDQASATTGSNRPSDGSPAWSIGNDPHSGDNALSVLLSALSSAQSTMTADIPPKPTAVPNGGSSIAYINGPQEFSHTTDPATRDVATTSVFQNTDGDPTAARKGGDLVSVSQGGLPAVAATDNVATSATRTYGATSDMTAVANPPTQTTDMALDPLAHATSFTVNGQPITASRQGSAMVLADASQTETALPGKIVRLGSQDLSFQFDGTNVVVGTATFAVPNAVDPTSADDVSTWTKGGSVYTATLLDGSVKLEGPDITTTLPAGGEATVAGDAFTMPTFDGANAEDEDISSSGLMSLDGASGPDQSVQNFEGFIASATASAAGSAVVVHQGSVTFTLGVGQQTTMAEHTFSVASSVDAVIVDGSRSISVAPPPTGDSSSTSTMNSESGTGGLRTSDAESTTTSPSAEGVAGRTWTIPIHLSYAFACAAIMIDLL